MRIGEKKKKRRNPKRILRPDEVIPVRKKGTRRIQIDTPVEVPLLVPKEVNVDSG